MKMNDSLQGLIVSDTFLEMTMHVLSFLLPAILALLITERFKEADGQVNFMEIFLIGVGLFFTSVSFLLTGWHPALLVALCLSALLAIVFVVQVWKQSHDEKRESAREH